MENEQIKPKEKDRLLPVSILISAIIIAGAWVYTTGLKTPITPKRTGVAAPSRSQATLEEGVLPSEGLVLPIRWGNLGAAMVSTGVIDKAKFESIYAGRGNLTEDEQKLLEATDNGNILINQENSGFLLNLLWALGLGNRNDILERGPMNDQQYGGAQNFASTGGWTLARGNVMNHYSAHEFIRLTPAQQQLDLLSGLQSWHGDARAFGTYGITGRKRK